MDTPAANTDQNGRKYYIGPKGGCYYLTASGKKTYVDKKLCGTVNAPLSPAGILDAPAASESKGSRTYIMGPKGGCYYINGSGKKTYVDRSLCN